MTTLHVANWATECLVAHTAPVGCRVAHPIVAAGHNPGQTTGSVLRVTQTGAVERITCTSVTITRNWLKESVHDVGYCGRIASRDKHPIFLVRGSCRVHNVESGYHFSVFFFEPVAASLLAQASTVYVKEVTLTL